MPSNSWNQTLATLKAAGPALSNTTTATSLLGTGASQDAKFNLPSNFLTLGSKLRIRAAGVASTTSASPGTITFSVVFGSTTVYTGAASPTVITSASSAPFTVEVDLTCQATGGSTNGSVEGSGTLFSTGLLSAGLQLLGSSSGTGFDCTASQVVDFYAKWSVANSTNSINLTDYELISCN